jgi:hypothetical protein
MASMTLTRTAECAAQNHITIEISGDVQHTYHGDMDELTAPVTEAEKDAFVKLLIRFAKIGRTRAQIRNALGNGVTVTI